MSLWVTKHASPSRTTLDTKRLTSSVVFWIRPLQALLQLNHFRPEDISVGEIAANQLSVRLVPKQRLLRTRRRHVHLALRHLRAPSTPRLRHCCHRRKKRENAAVSSNSLEKWKTTQTGLCPSPHHLPLVHRQRDHPLHDRHRLHRLNRLGRHLRQRQRHYQ
jgi:hypothetical protein